MIYADSHTHSVFSFDGHQSVDELCRAAMEKGIQKIALTDHLDCDGEFEGYYDHYDAEGAKKAVLEAREKYEGKVEIAYGVELGQPYTHPEKTRALIEKQGFDFIIGSLHNLVGVPDFCMLDYTKMTDRQIELLWQRDLDETYRLLLDTGAHGCRINTLAHLTYPIRYVIRAGKTLDMKPFAEQIEQIFLRLIEKGIALEVNTSGLRQGAGMTFPDENLIRFYRSLGGEMITVGSDAHFSEHVGCSVKETYELLREIGFSYVCYFGHNGLTHISLN